MDTIIVETLQVISVLCRWILFVLLIMLLNKIMNTIVVETLQSNQCLRWLIIPQNWRSVNYIDNAAILIIREHQY